MYHNSFIEFYLQKPFIMYSEDNKNHIRLNLNDNPVCCEDANYPTG